MNVLKGTLDQIVPLNQEVVDRARRHVNNLAKPMGSMGRLEDLYVQLAGITGETYPELKRRAIVVMSADHGIVEEGVATGLQRVTLAQTLNFVKGLTGVCALAKASGAQIVPVDVGIAGDYDEPGIQNKKIRYGTANFTKGPAMTREEAVKSIETGIEIAKELVMQGVQVLGTGEMGIGNTTPSSAILSVFSGKDALEVTGVGANLPENQVPHKAEVIRKGILVNRPNADDAIDVLYKVGGLEIGGMAGVMLGAAACKCPVIIDGFISTVSALIALRLKPEVSGYLIPSHKSKEKGAQLASVLAGLEPMLDMDMRLGEGTGAALMFNILEASVFMAREMATFEGAGIAVV